jgi:hypothetical protein
LKEHSQIAAQVQRWSAAGLIDAQAAERILAFEAGQERKATLRWPVFLAMIFGGMLLAAGVTLFVAAHWSELSPALRFSLMIVLAGLFHISGALLAERFSALATTLHGVGTATLGAAIFLTAQIFNLHENWATGILLWSLGAAAGYALLRDWVQATFLAILAPAWLISQWEITTEWRAGGGRLFSVGLILTAICYLSARIGEQTGTARRALAAIGTIAFVSCTITASIIALEGRISWRYHNSEALTSGILLLGWTVAVGTAGIGLVLTPASRLGKCLMDWLDLWLRAGRELCARGGGQLAKSGSDRDAVHSLRGWFGGPGGVGTLREKKRTAKFRNLLLCDFRFVFLFR